MKITYLILTHRYPLQLFRLIKRLDGENVIFLIHIDKKTDQKIYDEIVKHLKLKKNIYFIKRYVCNWAGYGIVQATYQGLKELIEREISFDYVCLMSGQDYPIKSNEYIFSFFLKHQGKSFINCEKFPHPSWPNEKGGFDRIENWYFITSSKQYGFPNKVFKNRPRLNKVMRTIMGGIIVSTRPTASFG